MLNTVGTIVGTPHTTVSTPRGYQHFPVANDLSVEEAAFEMYEYYKYWMERTFNGESFEVFETAYLCHSLT